MQVIETPNDIFELTSQFKLSGKKIGLVPTMGALHEGHLSLVRASTAQNDETIVTIFVNPLQFNNSEDLQKYPRNLQKDLNLLEKEGVKTVFAPNESDMYSEQPVVNITFGKLGETMEGAFRPGHFDGVGVVVSKLFHMCQPDIAYFGLKDLQQYLLIKRMARDLSFQVEVVGIPIKRELSGLAMSSRNGRLSGKGLITGARLYEGLQLAATWWDQGLSPSEINANLTDFFLQFKDLQLEYFELVSPDNLETISDNQNQSIAFCVAGYVEGVRLIDNLYLR